MPPSGRLQRRVIAAASSTGTAGTARWPASRPAAASSASAATFDQRQLLPRRGPGRLQHHAVRAGHAAQPPRRLPAVRSTRRISTRSSNGWGSITVPGGGTSFQGTPIFYLAAFQQQGLGSASRRSTPSSARKSIEVNDTINWKNWTFNVGLLAEQRHAVRPGPERRVGDAVGLRAGDRHDVGVAPVQDVRDPVQQDDPAAPERDLGLQRQGHGRSCSYARYNPAASSLPRAASWDRNLATTIQAYFDANGEPVRDRSRSRPRPASCSSRT